MRITLNLDPEVLVRVRLLAKQRSQTMGAVASELIVQGAKLVESPGVRNGVPLLVVDPRSERERPRPDLELVNRLRDDEP